MKQITNFTKLSLSLLLFISINFHIYGTNIKGNDTNLCANTKVGVDSLIQYVINKVNLDTLKHYVNILSGKDSVMIDNTRYLINSRNASQPNNNIAAEFIFQTLQLTGLNTFNQNYSSSGRNVFSVQTGTDFPDKKFIICAHYDDMPSWPPAPGADDNASGTAAVLEAARILSKIQTAYTIVYALWDEEEIGLIGSDYYAQQAYSLGEEILGVINLDMISWDSNNDGLMDIHSEMIANSEGLAELSVALENQYSFGLSPTIYNPGTYASDHSSFWSRGYSAIMFIEAYYGGDFNNFYHSPNDIVDNFNLSYFHSISKLAIATISYLALNNLVTDIKGKEQNIISNYMLGQNYPNPFNPTTKIKYQLPNESKVFIKIYNILGSEVMELINEQKEAGVYEVEFNADNLSSGTYFYRLQAGSFVQTRKMILLK